MATGRPLQRARKPRWGSISISYPIPWSSVFQSPMIDSLRVISCLPIGRDDRGTEPPVCDE